MALDGVIMTDKDKPFIFHIGRSGRNEWFQVDLGMTEYVEGVYLQFRSDYPLEKYGDRREGIVVRVGNEPASSNPNGNPICGEIGNLFHSFLASLTCRNWPTGQFIVVKKEHGGNKYWDIDEINAHIL